MMNLEMDDWQVYVTIGCITVGIFIVVLIKLYRAMKKRQLNGVGGVNVVPRSISHISDSSVTEYLASSQQITMRRRTLVFSLPRGSDGIPQQLDVTDLPPDYDSAMAAKIYSSTVHFSVEEADRNPPTYENATKKPETDEE